MTSRLSADLIGELIDAGSREHYNDAALYDYEYRRRRADVAFYRELAVRRLGASGRILELGAGSGRVTVQLARAGFEVTAIDSNKQMLAKLRERMATLPKRVAERITIVEADLRNFKVPGEFPLAIAVFNVLEHLYTRVELDACLRCVRDHLAPGGAFAFDVQLPDLAWLLRDPWTRWARTKFTDPTSGKQMIYSTNHEYDPISQIVLIRIYYELAGNEGAGPIKIVKLSQRKFFPAELEALIAHAGLRTVERYGDFGWRELDSSAESQVLICERALPLPNARTASNAATASTASIAATTSKAASKTSSAVAAPNDQKLAARRSSTTADSSSRRKKSAGPRTGRGPAKTSKSSSRKR